MMKKIALFLAFLPLTACATMFNGTEQDVKISFYDAQTGAPISNDKVRVTTAKKDLTLNEDQSYTLKRKQAEELHFLSPEYAIKINKIYANTSGLHYLNLIWGAPLLFVGLVGGPLGELITLSIYLGLSLGVDMGAGGIYVYPDEIKVFLDPRSK